MFSLFLLRRREPLCPRFLDRPTSRDSVGTHPRAGRLVVSLVSTRLSSRPRGSSPTSSPPFLFTSVNPCERASGRSLRLFQLEGPSLSAGVDTEVQSSLYAQLNSDLTLHARSSPPAFTRAWKEPCCPGAKARKLPQHRLRHSPARLVEKPHE